MAQSIYRLPSTTNNARTTTERGRMRFFRTHELLSNLPEHLLSDLERSAREQNFRKKQTIWSPGDTADRVFFTRGALIGEYAALFPEPRDTRCEAYEDSTLYAIPREDFQRVLQRSPILGTEVARVIGTRRRRLENRLKNLIFRTAHARLAGLFLDLSEDFGVRDSRGVIVNLKLTHREMAALIGATRETVSFAILDLRKEGLILTEGRRVILLDVERLEALRDQ
jgi:CRP/FNR family cyclic AMP-dependent transcriptional regulator